MRHSTNREATRLVPTSPARILAATIATALVASGLGLAAAAPANAAVTGAVTGYSLSWGFQTGANGWKIEADGADLIDGSLSTVKFPSGSIAAYQISKGFRLTGGQGSIDPATKVGTVDFDSTIKYYPQWSYAEALPDQPWLELSEFELTTESGMRGSLTAVVDLHKSDGADLVTPTRVAIAEFGITTLTVTGADVVLQSAAPDWDDVVPAGTYSQNTSAECTASGCTDSWPKAFVDLLRTPTIPGGDWSAYFYRSGTTAGNTAKVPVALSLSSELATPSVEASIASASPKAGVKIAVSGDGFRGVTNGGDAGIYVGIAAVGGLPDVSTPGAVAGFAGASYVPASALASGTFATTVTVPRAKVVDGTPYAVYTWQAHGHSNTSQDTETAIDVSFASVQWKTTTIAIAPSSPTATVGSSVMLNSIVPIGATGTVEFFDGANSLGSAPVASGSASLAAAALVVGEHSLTASYSGDDFYPALVSAAAAVSVKKLPSSVALSLSAGSARYATAVIATATVTPAGAGTVTFSEGTTVLSTVAVSGGRATLPLTGLAVGSHPIVATYSGSATTDAAASAAATLSVTQLTPKVSVSGKAFVKNTKPKVSVKVAKLANGSYATGKVTLYVAGKAVKTVTLKASAGGKVAVTLPKRYARAILVKAKYLGTTTVGVKVSASTKLKLKK